MMDRTQLSQEQQYDYPYHYIPLSDDRGFSQASIWSWGMRYLGGLEAVLAQLKKREFQSLIDVGCGDGRFLRQVGARYPDRVLIGVDYSERAIALAKAMNPSIEYRCQNLTRDGLDQRFDIATLIEVLEHIPPQEIDAFLKAVARHLQPAGTLLLTVPHINKRVQEKHYQHFSVESLTRVLEKSFKVDDVIPFDRISRLTGGFIKWLGYTSGNYVITNRWINNVVYQRVLRGCLERQPEKRSGRLLAIAQVR